MKKYQRLVETALNRLISRKEAKIIALLGARQVGKTTLLADFGAKWPGKVINFLGDKLEDARLWRGNFSELKNQLEASAGQPLSQIGSPLLLIFDEIQKIPEAFNNLKIVHDSYKEKIKIAISGSSSLSLLHRASESLGGRIEIINMYPLAFAEILSDSPRPHWLEKSAAAYDQIKANVLKLADTAEKAQASLDRAISCGLFPEAFLQEELAEVRLLHQNYHQTYIEKDVRDLKEVGNILDFDLVWKIAHRTSGQLLNYTNIARETGLAFNTVKKYVSVLLASFNLYLLPSYTRSIRGRLVKSPKIFSLDNGFFNHCLNLYEKKDLLAANFVGRIFEASLVTEFIKQERSFLFGGEPFFFRTTGGAEVDLVVERGADLFAYEFKYSARITSADFAGLKSLSAGAVSRLKAGFVVSRQPYAEKFGDNLFAVPWWYFCLS